MTRAVTENVALLVLIVMNDVLVTEDLAEAINEVWPDALIVRVHKLDHAEAAISGRGRVVMAFVQDDPARLHGSSLESVLQAQGATVVLTGDWGSAQVGKYGWDVLPSPFSAQDVHALILRHAPRILPDASTLPVRRHESPYDTKQSRFSEEDHPSVRCTIECNSMTEGRKSIDPSPQTDD